MRHLLPILLTLTVLLGSTGMGWSADLQKGLDAANRGDYATALRELKPLAEQGNINAQYMLGVQYERGNSGPRNHKTAVKWYTRAAEQGNAPAQYNLANMYKNGKGVPWNKETAVKWWALAAKHGAL